MLDFSVTVRAETVDKAIDKGLQQLNITRDKADVHVISEGKKGVFGFGKQDAIVEVRSLKKNSLNDLMGEVVDSDTSETQAVIEPETTLVDIPNTEVSVNEVVEEAETLVVESTESEPASLADQLTDEAQEVVDTVKLETTEQSQAIATGETHTEPDEALDNMPRWSIEEVSASVSTYIEDVARELGAPATVTFEWNRGQVVFNIETEMAGILIGKHGKMINALQVLAQTHFQSLYRPRVTILVNVGDYRNRRAQVLRKIAKRTADEVLKTKQAVILEPLPAYERKLIHAHLARIDHIKTHSEGIEPNRFLVVDYKA